MSSPQNNINVMNPPNMNMVLSDILFPRRNNFEIYAERKNGWNPDPDKNTGIFLNRPEPAEP